MPEWEWCRAECEPGHSHGAELWSFTSCMEPPCADQEGEQWGWLISSALWSLPAHFSYFGFFYRQSCFEVHDVSLMVSVSMMGFCELQGNGFVKHDTFMYKIFARFVTYLLLYLLSNCTNCFYFVRSPEGSKKVQASFPILGLCVPAGAEKPGRCGSGCRGSIFMKEGLSLALCETNLATVLAPSSLTVQAQAREDCVMQPKNSHSTFKAWWHHETILFFLLISSSPGFWLWIRLSCKGWIWEGNPVWWHFCLA